MKKRISILATACLLSSCSTSTVPPNTSEEASADSDLQEQTTTPVASTGTSQKDYDDLNEKFELLKNDYLEIDTQLKSEQEAHLALESEHADTLIKLDALQADKQNLVGQIDEWKEKEKLLNSQLEQKDNVINKLKLQITQLEKTKISSTAKKYNEQINKLEKSNQALAKLLAQSKLDFQQLADEKKTLEQDLSRAAENKTLLEQKLADLIDLEASVSNLEQQLSAGLTNVLWQIPATANLDSVFEIIVTADITPEFNGRLFVAELLPDSSFELISADSVEAQAVGGRLQWRWRVKGVDERVKAKVNLFIHQSLQYQNDRILRQVYRDQKYIELNNDNIIEKYGFWALAIVLGLFGGYLIGWLNNRTRKIED